MVEKKRLLAIDGGGILGLIALGALAEIERQFREANDDPSLVLRDCFHYIAGTSTGAIIASGLMLGMPVEKIRQFYLQSGADIFTSAPVWMRPFYLYGRKKLVEILTREFGEKTIFDLQEDGRNPDRKPEDLFLPLDRHLLIVTNNETTGSPWPLSSNVAGRYNDHARENCNLKVELWKLVRASTAAPVYFPPEEVTFGNTTFRFEDGGITPYNNPAFQLYRMATMPQFWVNDPDAMWETGEDRMMLVSVGNSWAEKTGDMAALTFGGKFIGNNARQVPSTLMRAMSVENDLNCRREGRCVHGPHIDREIGDMIAPLDHASDAPYGDKKFLYARYDIDVSQPALDSVPELKGISAGDITLDNTKAIPDLDRIGQINGRQVDLEAQFGRAFLTL